MTKLFYAVFNSLVVSLNTFVWFAVTFWVHLQTQSVLATSIMQACISNSRYLDFFGSLVDRYKKKTVMMFLPALFPLYISIRLHHFISAPTAVFTDPSSVILCIYYLGAGRAIAGTSADRCQHL